MAAGNGAVAEMPHNLIVSRAHALLTELYSDPFLQDLPLDRDVDNVQQQLALVQGKAVTVHVEKFDGDLISVIILQGATLSDLVRSLQRKVEEQCSRENRTEHLSWNYIWKNYILMNGQTLLGDKRAKIQSYGIGNQTVLRFSKRLKL